jgi:hypothetical protein
MGEKCNTYLLVCFTETLNVYLYSPTTTTTTTSEDPLCYLVDCEGNYIVDCDCNYIVGCGCNGSLTTTSSTTTGTSTSTTTSSTTTTTTSSTSSSTTSTSTTSYSELLVVPEGANLVSFGDSITTDNYVPSGLPALYTSLLASDLGITSARYAQGNSGFKSLMRFIHQGCDGLSCETLNSPITPNTNVVTELYGLNNVYYEGDKTNKLAIVRNGVNTLLAIQWSSSIVNGANSSIVRTGTFTDYTARVFPVFGRFGSTSQSIPNTTNAVFSNTPGSYLEYTATFKHAFVGMVGSCGLFSGFPRGVVNIYINNVLYTTVDLGEQYPIPQADPGTGFGPDTETVGPVTIPIITNSVSTKTIKVELVSVDMAIDYISIIDNPSNCYPVVLGEIPYVNPSNWGAGSEPIADTYSGEKLAIVNTWTAEGFPIRYCDTNSYYNYVNTTDGTHPNDLGNQQVKNAFRALFV